MTRVFCFGGAHADRTARCHSAFLPGASNPVTVTATLGGAALNTAFNLKRLGNDVQLISVVGVDGEGAAVVQAVKDVGLAVQGLVRRPDQATANYTAILDDTGNLVAGLADMAIYESASPAELRKAVAGLGTMPKRGDFVFFDANLPSAVLENLTGFYQSEGLFLAAAAVSPAKVGRLSKLLGNMNFLFCSRAELAALAQVAASDEAALRQAGGDLSAEHGISVFMTQGAEGLIHFAEGMALDYPAPSAQVVDVNGAGDAFAGGTLHALMTGASAGDAIAFGQATAGLTLATRGSTASGLTAEKVSRRIAR